MSFPRTLKLGAACEAPPVWAQQDGVSLVWSTDGRGKPPVITDSRDGHGLLPLRVPNQAAPEVPITSEEGIAIKHKMLLLSLPWELMHPAAATAKCSGYLVELPRAHYHFPGPCN